MLTEEEIAMCESAKEASREHLDSLVEYNLSIQDTQRKLEFFKECYKNNKNYIEGKQGARLVEEMTYEKINKDTPIDDLRKTAIRNLCIKDKETREMVFHRCLEKNKSYLETFEGEVLDKAIKLDIFPKKCYAKLTFHYGLNEDEIKESLFIDNSHEVHDSYPEWQKVLIEYRNILWRPIFSNVDRLEEEEKVIKSAILDTVPYITHEDSGRSYFPVEWDGFHIYKYDTIETIDGHHQCRISEMKANENHLFKPVTAVYYDSKLYREFAFEEAKKAIGFQVKSKLPIEGTGEHLFLKIMDVEHYKFGLFRINVAIVQGDGELGSSFYISPRKLIKENTFEDGSPAGQLVQ